MEILFLLAIGVVIWWVFQQASGPENNVSSNTEQTRDLKHKPSQKIFKAKNSDNRGKIQFRSSVSTKNGGSRSGITSINLDGIVDAFTGIQIDVLRPKYSCTCGVFYQKTSFEVIQAENHSKCVACGLANITPYSETSAVSSQAIRVEPKNYIPNIVTLENYKLYTNQVVTFEGKVEKINVSQRGTDYAVMFENKTWVSGFKLVFFKGVVASIGGTGFVLSLKNKKIRVRGLLIKHQQYGYEIIINDQAMILDISL